MSFTVGAWVFPLFITIAAFWIASAKAPKSRGDYDFSGAIMDVWFGLGAAIVSLVGWLVWALL